MKEKVLSSLKSLVDEARKERERCEKKCHLGFQGDMMAIEIAHAKEKAFLRALVQARAAFDG